VDILDVNDNAPTFPQRQYETKLLENQAEFETPLQLEARDADLNGTENSQVTYEIVEGMYRSNFTIDPQSGLLRIIVSDVNDEIPTFAEYVYRCEVNENAQTNTPLNFIDEEVQNVVFDHDEGNNGTFRLFLDPPNDLFEIVPELAVNEANFMLRVKNSKSLDFEQFTEVNFTIFAREVDEPSRWR